MNNYQLNNCKIVNIVWTDRGILLGIMYYIIRLYSKLIKKIIIIDNKRYRKFLRIIFPNLRFKKSSRHFDNYFYFNIRTIIKKQDIIIDYLSNYDDTINTEKINLIPWFDMNDPLIIYLYDDKESLDADSYKKFIKDFVKCRRGSYNGYYWDTYMERHILNKYKEFVSHENITWVFNKMNEFLASEYTDTVNYYAKVFYQPVTVSQPSYEPYRRISPQDIEYSKPITPIKPEIPIKPIKKDDIPKQPATKEEPIDNEEKLQELIKIFTNKVNSIYDLME
jgi:hypothetical protein